MIKKIYLHTFFLLFFIYQPYSWGQYHLTFTYKGSILDYFSSEYQVIHPGGGGIALQFGYKFESLTPHIYFSTTSLEQSFVYNETNYQYEISNTTLGVLVTNGLSDFFYLSFGYLHNILSMNHQY